MSFRGFLHQLMSWFNLLSLSYTVFYPGWSKELGARRDSNPGLPDALTTYLRPPTQKIDIVQFIPTEYTELQLLSGLYSIMTEKLTQAGEDGGGEGVHAHHFHHIYHHAQSCGVHSSERADTLPLFRLYLYVLCVHTLCSLYFVHMPPPPLSFSYSCIVIFCEISQ